MRPQHHRGAEAFGSHARCVRAVVLVLGALAASAASAAALGACVDSPELSPLASDGDSAASALPGQGPESTTDASPPGSSDADAVDDGAGPDSSAAIDQCNAKCPASGGTCDGPTCVFACPGPAACASVTCPSGVPCRVSCKAEKACPSVNCGSASRCDVECVGKDSCVKLTSQANQTDITCTVKDACKNVSCDGARCTVQCNGEACKPNEVACCATVCTVNGMPGKCK